MKYWIITFCLCLITIDAQPAEHKQIYGLIAPDLKTKKITLENQSRYEFRITYYIPDHGFGGTHKKRRRTSILPAECAGTIKPIINDPAKKIMLNIALLDKKAQKNPQTKIACKLSQSHLTFIHNTENSGILIKHRKKILAIMEERN